ncbi:hypothetical protein J6590_106418 [Homalodisca vitripennis]|nr:hypothetical protein J6590_106418 [Homalodisca vitripennis]
MASEAYKSSKRYKPARRLDTLVDSSCAPGHPEDTVAHLLDRRGRSTEVLW